MSLPSQAQRMHLRSRSEPATPKNVHFPEKDNALATVHVFNPSAPTALSSPASSNGDETETGGEGIPPNCFPFPPPLSPIFSYEIDPTKSSPIPSKSSPENLLFESLNTSSSSFLSTSLTTKPSLTGSILVRNLAFEKHVAIRFTVDDWRTVSEVTAHYVDSLSRLPPKILSSSSPSTPADTSPCRGRGWDRFIFTIRLEDYAHALTTRTLWLAARYRIESTYPEPGSFRYGPGGEWWDNNGGGNYRVRFRLAVAAPTPPSSIPRRASVCAPIPSPRTQPQPPVTCKEHTLGLMVPSVHDHKENGCLTPLGTGKLNLCSYDPPTVRATSSISFPSVASPQASSSSSIANPALSPSTALQSLSDEDAASPASSILSTPSVSPTMVPCVIIGGHPAAPTGSSSEKDDDDSITSSRPGHIADWDCLAPPSNPRIKGPSRQHLDLVHVSEPPKRWRKIPLAPGRKALCNSDLLCDAFVTQWCFAQGPSPIHHGYDGSGIMT
ncbi:hypothetical protein OG21DRAFT_1509481 [Imleria badia]|nr:hypothetical protein OG21DRAFT_1509481 [Imleria badia]